VLLTAFTAASCGGEQAGPETAARQQQRPLSQDRSAQQGAARQPENNAAARSGGQAAQLSIPRDARWTVFCTSYTGPTHAAAARQAREQLLRTSPLRDWYTVTSDDRTTLYHGYYRSINDMDKDRVESERAQADRRAVQQIFRGAFLVELDAPDPASPPEWDLANTPADALYSVQIGVYKGSPERRAKAVEAVREAREKYKVPAYYHHGPTGSAVCIGAWPGSAVRENNPMKFGAQEEVAHGVPVLVPEGIKVPEGAVAKYGTPLTPVKASFEVLDPSLRATLREYDTHTVNGEMRVLIDPRTGAKRVEKLPSRIIRIPGRLTAQERLVEAQQRYRKGQARQEDLAILQDSRLVLAQRHFLDNRASPEELALLQQVHRVTGGGAEPPARGNTTLAGSPSVQEGPQRPVDGSANTSVPAAVLKPTAPKGGRLRSIED
jgi:hypothetical protein